MKSTAMKNYRIVLVVGLGLLWTLALAGCSDNGSETTTQVTIQTDADWVAGQNELGVWRTLTPRSDLPAQLETLTYTLETPKNGAYGVALKCTDMEAVQIYHVTTQETDTICYRCKGESSRSFSAAGRILNGIPDSMIQVSMSDRIAVLSAGETAYEISGLHNGLMDLAGLETASESLTPSGILLHRDLSVNESDNELDLDFANAILLDSSSFRVAGGDGVAFMVTGNNTRIPGLGVTENGQGLWYRPVEGIIDEDRTVFYAQDEQCEKSRSLVHPLTVQSDEYLVDLNVIAPLNSVVYNENGRSLEGLAYSPAPQTPPLLGFEIFLSSFFDGMDGKIFTSKQWLERNDGTYSLPDFVGVEGWAVAGSNDAATSFSCATVSAVMANQSLHAFINGPAYTSGLDLARVQTVACPKKSDEREWSISDDLKSALSFAVPKILKDELVGDQPLIYVFSTYDLLPEGTEISPYAEPSAFDSFVLKQPMWLLYLEPSPYEDMGHPIKFFLVDEALNEFLSYASTVPPAVNGTLFTAMPQKPLLSTFSPILRTMELEVQNDNDDERETKHEIVIYFEGGNGDYRHCAIGYNITENGTTKLQRIYDNAPYNAAHGPYNKSIGQYASFYEYALQVYNEGKAQGKAYGVSMVSIPVKAEAISKINTYFAKWFSKDPYCNLIGCELYPYNVAMNNCASFIKDGIHVALPGVVEWWPGLVEMISTPNSVFSVLDLHYGSMEYPHAWLVVMFDTTCICYGKRYISDVKEWKYEPFPDDSQCQLTGGSSGSYCEEYECANGMCQAAMADEYSECLEACQTPHKLGCLSPCTAYCGIFKRHIFKKGCGKYAGENAPTDWGYKCSELPDMGTHHAVKCTMQKS